MFKKMLLGVAIILISANILADNVKPIPVQAFFSFSKVAEVKISPDGKYLALIVADPKTGENRKELVLMTSGAQHKVTATFGVVGDQLIASMWWTTDDRILAASAIQTGSIDVPSRDGGLFAINADGTRKMQLMPTSSDSRHLLGGTARRHEDVWFGGMLHLDAKDPNHVLVYGYTRGLNSGYNQTGQAYTLDVDTGVMHKVVESPVENGGFITDSDGNIRIAVGQNTKTGNPEIDYRDNPDSFDWKNLSAVYVGSDPAGYDDIGPLGFEPGDKSIFWLGHTSTSTLGLYSLDPQTLKTKELYGDPNTDISDIVWNFQWSKPDKIVAVETMPGYPQLHVLDPNDPKASWLASLYQAFNGQVVDITSNTQDQSLMVVKVSSDTNPGDYYLFNTKTAKAEFLFHAKPGIDPNQMASMRPVEFKARDGVDLHGYLTIPPRSSGKNLPLIINPHGGPHGVRDEWGWNPEAQFLAYHGYAVLQVNYRGSSGYGMKFQDLGYGHWATTMQDDLADAVKWAIKQGVADPKRVCIYGASYGGYAALENSIRYPDMYKCTVGYVGLYDLKTMNDSDFSHYASGKHYIGVSVGRDDKTLEADSPVYHTDKLKDPVFIIYGGADVRVVPQNAEELMDAMDKNGKYYEKMYERNEMHGFYKPEHRYELYTRMLAFFDKYIGPTAAKH
jgi:dipeptidyl aminopeptidase/acylaminoacyl peptidase